MVAPLGAVGVKHAGLDRVEEAVELGAVLRVDSRGEAKGAAIGVGDRVVEIVERKHADEGQEELVAVDPMIARRGR